MISKGELKINLSILKEPIMFDSNEVGNYMFSEFFKFIFTSNSII